MYFISIVIIVAVLFMVAVLGAGSAFGVFLDLPSLLVFILTVIPSLTAGGLLKDFFFAFKIAKSTKDDFALLQMKNSVCAVKLAIKTIVTTATFLAVSGLMIILSDLTQSSKIIGTNLSVAIMSLCYAAIFLFILVPLKARIQKMINQKLASSENE